MSKLHSDAPKVKPDIHWELYCRSTQN